MTGSQHISFSHSISLQVQLYNVFLCIYKRLIFEQIQKNNLIACGYLVVVHRTNHRAVHRDNVKL